MLPRAPVVVGLVLALSGAAESATLLTPPVFAGLGASLTCLIANVGSSPREVTIEVVRFNGSVAERVTTTVEPGVSGSAAAEVAGLGRCRFIVPGSAKGYRATGCAIEGTHGCRGSMVAD